MLDSERMNVKRGENVVRIGVISVVCLIVLVFAIYMYPPAKITFSNILTIYFSPRQTPLKSINPPILNSPPKTPNPPCSWSAEDERSDSRQLEIKQDTEGFIHDCTEFNKNTPAMLRVSGRVNPDFNSNFILPTGPVTVGDIVEGRKIEWQIWLLGTINGGKDWVEIHQDFHCTTKWPEVSKEYPFLIPDSGRVEFRLKVEQSQVYPSARGPVSFEDRFRIQVLSRER